MGEVLVVGLGTRLCGDDAAGLEVARRLREEATARVLEWEGEPIGLLDRWRSDDTVIVIDATSPGSAAGKVVRFDAREGRLPVPLDGRSTHAVGLAETIEIARALGQMPADLVVYGIEAAVCEAGAPMSSDVARAVDHVVDVVAGEVRAWKR